MVLIHYKKTDTNQFLYSVPAATPNAEVIHELVTINNMRIEIDKLAVFIEDLATHGPIKPEELRGLTDAEILKSTIEQSLSPEVKKYIEKPKLQPGQRINEDKTGYRIGVILPEETTRIMMEEVEKAKKYISKDQVQFKVPLTV
jgi:hypothetical protein